MNGLGVRWRNEDASFGDGDPLEAQFRAADKALAHDVYKTLIKHYEATPWLVEASHKRGIVKVRIMELMPDNEWWVIPIRTLEGDSRFHCVVRAGGELLERFRIGRSGFSEADFQAALRRNPLAYRGSGSKAMTVPS